MKCCLCGGEIETRKNALGEVLWDRGHNPSPLDGENCCSFCNVKLVIPARLENLRSINDARFAD